MRIREDGLRKGQRLPFAHSANAQGVRHDLVQHLVEVADLAASFADHLSAREIGYYAGLWHDVGKFSDAFQRYLHDCENPERKMRGPDHKAAGATLASEHLGLAALVIQGHHGGLKSREDFRNWLVERAKKLDLTEAVELAAAALPNLVPCPRPALPIEVENNTLSAEFFVRMLFSALVDADYLDTERHFRLDRSALRSGTPPLESLSARFNTDQARISGRGSDVLSRARHEIYQACLDAADHSPGLFRLSVPTGGGKTRSAMGFALRHALRQGLRRVVMAVPFVTITEQTAGIYRGIFGDDAVLEHHSAVRSPEDETGDFHNTAVRHKLAAENWDVPIVVTTSIQLFESLFANSTSQTRKLHRLARSVIIVDEAQALPAYLLTPILDALRQLCAHYGATVVISTATQPAFESIAGFASLGAREIVPDPGRFFRLLDRVTYEWPNAPMTWSECARRMRSAAQCLVVVNTKRDAFALLDALGDTRTLHLSTLLCGAHRAAVIQAVRELLASGAPCRVVSTQVIEAGVDLDFPLVMRAMAPLDAVIQAAGRCNREGRRAEKGRVIVFKPETGGMPAGFYRTAVGVTESVLGGRYELDPNDPRLAATYFERLFASLDTDRERIQEFRHSFNYPEVSARFRMIDEDTESVVVAYGPSKTQRRMREIIERLRSGAPDGRYLIRELQPYLVSVRTSVANKYRIRGLVREVRPGIGEWLGTYDPIRGLVADDPALTEPVI
jgi:CRISPR-associated endonuclease/helicase Cas3